MVLARGYRLPAVGIIIGTAGSAFAEQLLGRAVWRISLFDPIAIAAVSAVVLVAGLAACAIPARRTTYVDPILALRDE